MNKMNCFYRIEKDMKTTSRISLRSQSAHEAQCFPNNSLIKIDLVIQGSPYKSLIYIIIK